MFSVGCKKMEKASMALIFKRAFSLQCSPNEDPCRRIATDSRDKKKRSVDPSQL